MKTTLDLIIEHYGMKELHELTRVRYEPVSAVYFLFLGTRLQYIGQTLNMQSRLVKHREKCWFKWDRYAFVDIHPEDLLRMENAYIKKFDPPCNRTLRGSINNSQARKRTPKKAPVVVDINALVEKMSR